MTSEDQILAAELALGLAEDEDLAAARARIADEPAFAEQVAWWRARFAALYVDYTPAPPATAMEERVAALLGDHDRAPAAMSQAPTMHPHRLWPWVAGGAVGGAIAASLAAVALIPPVTAPTPTPRHTVPATPAPPTLAAAVVPSSGEKYVALPIVVRPGARAVRVAALPDVPDRRVAQLWRIGADGVPHALGLLHNDGITELNITVSLSAGDTLAISIEPPGGSPKVTPTGPVVATGKLVPA